MSKLLDLMEKVGHEPPAAFGFGPASRRAESHPAMVLLGRYTPKQLAKAKNSAKIHIDAVLLSLDEWSEGTLEPIAASLEGRVWGVQIDGIDGAQAAQLKDIGCDFILVQPGGAAASLLLEEDLATLIPIGGSLSEETARAIHDLPIDAVVFTPEGDLSPLTVQKMMEYQAVLGMVSKPFLVSVPSSLAAAELGPLRELGTVGLVLDSTSQRAVSRIRKALDGLPKRRGRRDRGMALVPQVGRGAAEHAHGAPDEDEDDFE